MPLNRTHWIFKQLVSCCELLHSLNYDLSISKATQGLCKLHKDMFDLQQQETLCVLSLKVSNTYSKPFKIQQVLQSTTSQGPLHVVMCL